MAFYEGRLPTCIRYGYRGGATFQTSIVTVNSGAEQRNGLWSNGRGKWDIEYIKDFEGMKELQKFFHARQGMLQGFRFKDWLDYEDDGLGVLENKTPTSAQLAKAYNSTPYLVRKPVSSTIKVFKNGVEMTGISVNSATGVITGADFTLAGTYSWTGEFDKPVRFDTDSFSASITDKGIYTVDNLPIIEIKDYQ